MPITREVVISTAFNKDIRLPYELRMEDISLAMKDVYDHFHDINEMSLNKGLRRWDDMLRPASMSGIISDMLTASLAKHARVLVENKHFNGHPDLIPQGIYVGDSVKAGEEGVEIKSTRKKGGAVDTHGARDQWMCVFIYEVDNKSEPAVSRAPMRFTEVYLAKVSVGDFRKNKRGELGTKTATLDKDGLKILRAGWIYRLEAPPVRRSRKKPAP